MEPIDVSDDLQRAKLNQETAKIRWTELQRFFAQGVVLWVRPGLDLVDIAMAMTKDDAERIRAERSAGGICPVTDQQAREWLEEDACLWAVVVKPWILAQEAECTSGSMPTPAHG
ncbi:DUF2288 domain-containing protein [Thiorhodococcus mannitoliphagus]|uniref:DUF2288 domain-containing protein n=1 Tax=Thiorhodococcus mannitoliphagus TaxID=329406 RepID=A0A6P1DVD6_9GAMM|nr:DUF2288 domain-containing protein [Thiorhodococcus mannitoliphagus]NEX21440.1 DUF2288 domain-containing protein [Thiorhodococcus mannitoliphagus]